MTGIPTRTAIACSLATVLLLALICSGSARAADRPQAPGSVALSDERSSTHWAHPVQRAPIRRLPRPHAPQITSIHQLTEDGFPEVYLTLRFWRDSRDHLWLKVRIPMRPNGRTGWVRASALGPLNLVRTRLVVDRSEQRAVLYRRGRRIWSEPIGVGASSTPTPAGDFWIREKFRTGNPGSLYGPVAFGTSAYSVLSDWPGGGVVGIHGTDRPGLIPGSPSHGCIRVKNAAVRRLYRLLPIGTPVLIR